MHVRHYIEERTIELANYIIKHKCTIRNAAKAFNVSKSTVHKDVAVRLRFVDSGLYKKVKPILEENKAERHLRGGMATKEKYSHLKAAGKK